MGLKYIKDAVCVTGKYVNAQGEEKNSYLTVGKFFERDDGSNCMKLDAVPVGTADGWINFYDKKERPGGGGAPKAQAAPEEPMPDDSIPF